MDVEDLYARFANRLREIRQEEGLTQEELAKKIETTYRFVQMMESGKHAPGFQTLTLLMDALDRPAKDFFDFRESSASN